jgi:putative transcriptional regulator
MAKQGKTTTASSSSEPNLAADKLAFVPSAASEDQPKLDLSDHFLIAMPSMSDPVFGGTVVYVCEHHIGGALGVIINKPTEMTMDVLFSRLDLKLEINLNDEILPDAPVMFGGPVQLERGFVLHAPQTTYSSSLKISEELALTTSRDVLDAVANGRGPSRYMVTLGCAGWSAGQLEAEIVNNGWLTVRADPAILFNTPVEQRFTAAMRLLGISPGMLSGEAGHA